MEWSQVLIHFVKYNMFPPVPARSSLVWAGNLSGQNSPYKKQHLTNCLFLEIFSENDYFIGFY